VSFEMAGTTHPTTQCPTPQGMMSQNYSVLKRLLISEMLSMKLKCLLYLKRTVQMNFIEG
jgi:hypothetical protein